MEIIVRLEDGTETVFNADSSQKELCEAILAALAGDKNE